MFSNLKIVLNDDSTGLATAIYRSALVHPRSSGDPASSEFVNNLPSYIDSRNFATALITALGLDNVDLAVVGKADIENWIQGNIPAIKDDQQMRGLVAGFIKGAAGDPQRLVSEIQAWSGQVSDRITGAYKRRTQVSTVSIALVLAVTFDLNPLPPAIATLSQATSGFGFPAPASAVPPAASAPGQPMPGPAVPRSPAPPPGAGNDPVATMHSGVQSTRRVAETLMGWLITALSSLLGAPFWFALISKVTNVRGSGNPPPAAPAAGAPPPTGGSAPPPPDGPKPA